MNQKQYLLEILERSRAQIKEVNEDDEQLEIVYWKIDWIEKMVKQNKVADLTTMITYIFYAAELGFTMEGQ